MRPVLLALALAFPLAVSTACGAVYPEVSTPARTPPAGATLTPPPPDDLFFLRFKSATIPKTTRDGRSWDAVGGAAPDPFAKLYVDDKEIIRTPVQGNTLSPTWPDQKIGNYRVPKSSVVKVELWDSNAINHAPICVKVIREFHDSARGGMIDVDCDSGARIELVTEPAHARIGLGFRYEFRTQSMHVTRVVAESPAARVGLKAGDEIVKIQGQEVPKIDDATARDLINANAPTRVALTIRRADGSTVDLSLKDGPVYPTLDDDVPVQ